MKSIILAFLIVLFASFSVPLYHKTIIPVQTAMFTGTWKYQNGNEVFIVNLWADADGFKGKL